MVRFNASATVRVAIGKLEVALDRKAADAEAPQLGEGGVALLIQVLAERREALAEELCAVAVELRSVTKLAAGREDKLRKPRSPVCRGRPASRSGTARTSGGPRFIGKLPSCEASVGTRAS